MSKLVFPQRKRCKGCRVGLGEQITDEVLYGLYCSYRCAGIARPASRPTAAPRHCTTQREGRVVFKKRYRSVFEIPQRIREDPSADHYWCEHCGHLHIGHSRKMEYESHRVLRDVDDLADVLVKARGQATRREVAQIAGIRPIRLKELEEPGTAERIDLGALFAVLAVYRIKPAVVFAAQR